MLNIIKKQIEDSILVKKSLLSFSGVISDAGELMVQTFKNNKKVLLCGNGGSAADAQHIAAELLVRYKSQNDRGALPAISLSTDPSFITAVSNDMGYENLFSRSIEGIASEGDLLVGISTSGNSANIIKAVEAARRKKMNVLLLLGENGGRLKGKGDIQICVPSKETARIQEAHILIGHILCAMVEKSIFGLD